MWRLALWLPMLCHVFLAFEAMASALGLPLETFFL
jgi:hypothetical protein